MDCRHPASWDGVFRTESLGMGARRVWARGILLQCALLLFACKSFDQSLLEPQPGANDARGMAGRAALDSGMNGPDAGDSTKAHGTGGQNGSGGKGPAAGSGGAGALTE